MPYYTKKLASNAIKSIVTRLEKISEKNFFHDRPGGQLPQRICEPLTGTIKQSQLITTKPNAITNGTPFCTLMVMIITVAAEVRSERNIWPA